MYHAADFLSRHCSSAVSYVSEIQKLVAVLQSLKPVSDLAGHYLQLLKSFSPSVQTVEAGI